MASSLSGNGDISTGNDPVSDKLLSHVSHFVIGPVRKQFATDPLGLRDEQYDNIEEENSKAQRRNYEVKYSHVIKCSTFEEVDCSIYHFYCVE